MAAENKRRLSAGKTGKRAWKEAEGDVPEACQQEQGMSGPSPVDAECKPPAKRARRKAKVLQQGLSVASPVKLTTTQSTDVVRSPRSVFPEPTPRSSPNHNCVVCRQRAGGGGVPPAAALPAWTPKCADEEDGDSVPTAPRCPRSTQLCLDAGGWHAARAPAAGGALAPPCGSLLVAAQRPPSLAVQFMIAPCTVRFQSTHFHPDRLLQVCGRARRGNPHLHCVRAGV